MQRFATFVTLYSSIVSNFTYLYEWLKKNREVDNYQRIIMLKASDEEDFPNNFIVNYHTHLICLRGRVDFVFNDVKQSCKSGEFLFWFAKSNLIGLEFSKDFSATVLLVENQFLNDNIPDQNWGIDATLHSRQFPVKQLNDRDDKRRVLLNFELLNNKSPGYGTSFL